MSKLPATPKPANQYKHKIKAAWAPGGKCRTVAVFDPDSGRVIQLYTTLKSACAAAYYLSDILRHPSEWSPLSDYTIKNCIKRGRSEPQMKLFGYRWMFFDELRLGQVAFEDDVVDPNSADWSPKALHKGKEDNMIQMTTGQATFLFPSVEEAVSFYQLPPGRTLTDLRTRLERSNLNEWVTLDGWKWRKVLKTDSSTATSLALPILSDPTPSFDRVAVIKQDTLSGRQLVGFDSVSAAYEDWRRECETSPNAPMAVGLQTLEIFESFYLREQRPLDGLVWKIVSSKPKASPSPQRHMQKVAEAPVPTLVGKRPVDFSVNPNQSNDHKKPKVETPQLITSTQTTPSLPAIAPGSRMDGPIILPTTDLQEDEGKTMML